MSKQINFAHVQAFWRSLRDLGIRIDQLVFLDEAFFECRTADRRTGWALYGKRFRPVAKHTSKRAPRYSVMVAVDHEGLVDFSVVAGTTGQRYQKHWRGGLPGACDGHDLYTWLRQSLAMHLQPWPQRRSVLVMDGSGTHRNAHLLALLRSLRVCVVFLPAYCPHMNMAELQFNTLKRGVRKERARMGDDAMVVIPGLMERHRVINYTTPLREAGYFEVCAAPQA